LVGDVVFVGQFVFPRETTAEPLHEAIAENLHVAATRGRHSHVSVARCEFYGAVVCALRVLFVRFMRPFAVGEFGGQTEIDQINGFHRRLFGGFGKGKQNVGGFDVRVHVSIIVKIMEAVDES